MNTHQLRQVIGKEEFDYTSLLHALKKYKAPRQKINELIKTKNIIRVKKGLYVLNNQGSEKSYSKERLANLIYGPSYISLESALSFYQLIPERVESITSVTSKKNKKFKTPIGVFTYRYLNLKRYPLGVFQKEIAPGIRVLMASPEKALIDYISLELKARNHSITEIFFDLRLDENEFMKSIKRERLRKIVSCYKNGNVKKIMEYVDKGFFNG